jgi:Skp family chaperone for outer membrane proteins
MKRTALYIFIILQLTIDCWLLYEYFQTGETKSGYIIIDKVINECHLKKKLEASLKDAGEKRIHYLDSLEQIYQMRKAQGSLKDNEVAEYILKQRELLAQQQDQLAGEYNKQVFDFMNTQVKNYAKEKGFRTIIGATANGNMMYGADKDDMTDEILTYMNKNNK